MYVHFTSDIWSSTGGGHSYLSLTAHLWEMEGCLDSGHRWALLSLELIGTDHGANNISEYLRDMMRDWMRHTHSGANSGFMVTDAGRNMIRVVESAGFTNVACMVHLLHNCVKDGFKGPDENSSTAVTQLIDHCRRIAGFFHRSTKSAKLLHDRQTLECLPQHRLLQDVSTRWNSTYMMLERIVEPQRAVHAVSLSVAAPINKLVPNNQEWMTITQLVEILEPFKIATDKLSGQKALLSQVLPVILRLKRHLETLGGHSSLHSMAGPLTPQAQEVVRKLYIALRKHLLPLMESKTHVLAALCDPCIKDTMCPKDLLRWKEELVSLMRGEYSRRVGQQSEQIVDAITPQNPSGSASTVTNSPTLPPTRNDSRAVRQKRRCEENFIQDSIAFLSEEGTSLSAQAAKIDLAEYSVNRYLEEPQGSFSTDQLTYWSSRSKAWPDFSTVARKFLSCPPTSVQSERVFSLAGDVVTLQRNALDPLAVEKLVFLKANLPILGYPEIDFESTIP
ncbi:zinc finger BED domain-containing protein 4-like [Anolis sagrei]|uniref:zinc finger BED domain-containing protein 4-like n=1 Tax=Anolis sagrei TaxID=38937 RepID=UPI00351F9826